jgi:predicted DCC family thiol-disulfide oxidoreductase YuxK
VHSSDVGGSSELTVWYDGACPLCRREMKLMSRLDQRRAISFVDLAATPSVLPAPRANLLSQLHVRENGELMSGASAFAALWRAVPLLRPLGLLARIPVVLALLERAYGAFLRVRPKLQRMAMRARHEP